LGSDINRKICDNRFGAAKVRNWVENGEVLAMFFMTSNHASWAIKAKNLTILPD
jgi:hypothetical protein